LKRDGGFGGKRKTSFHMEKKFSSSPRLRQLFIQKKGLFPGDAGFAGEFAGFEAGGKDINHVVKDKLSVGLVAGDGVLKKSHFKFFGQHFNTVGMFCGDTQRTAEDTLT
jgi:hypothetical protein